LKNEDETMVVKKEPKSTGDVCSSTKKCNDETLSKQNVSSASSEEGTKESEPKQVKEFVEQVPIEHSTNENGDSSLPKSQAKCELKNESSDGAAPTVSVSNSKEKAAKIGQEEIKEALKTLESLGYTRSEIIIHAKANLAKVDTKPTDAGLKPSLHLLPGSVQPISDSTSNVEEKKGRKICVEVVKAPARQSTLITETASTADKKLKKPIRLDMPDGCSRTNGEEDKENTRYKPCITITTCNLSPMKPPIQPFSPLTHVYSAALGGSKMPFSPTHCYSPNVIPPSTYKTSTKKLSSEGLTSAVGELNGNRHSSRGVFDV
jgi:hypothetical protein